jgi:EAL domain-containing protein (putative c-di-GMP-specific phosphodiesterase class I)
MERFDLESDLRGALERGELEPHYQPVIDLRDRRITGVEALARWRHPTRGLVHPSEFLSVAQDAGLLAPISWQMLGSALVDFSRWLEHGVSSELDLAVNLARGQLADPMFVERLMIELHTAGVAPERLVVEITETEMLRSVDSVRPKLVELRRRGVRVALDDFGTGYTALNYLASYPVDILKIDRSFVSGLQHRDDHLKIVRTIIELARSFDLDVIAEGVEDEHEAAALLSLGSSAAQGFAFHRPAPADEVELLLLREATRAPAAVAVTGERP